MEEEVCFRCERKGDEVKLVDAVYDREIVKICEECAVSENIPMIRKPTSEQIKLSEKPYSVIQRMRRMTRVEEKLKQPEQNFSSSINLDKLRKPKDYKAVLASKFQSAKAKNQALNLVDNYNWHIAMARKQRKVSRKQLADAIGESETTVKLIEERFVPDDAMRIINKIEQYLGVRLKKDSQMPVASFSSSENPARVLKFDPSTAKNFTIDDLRRMKEAREKADDSENLQFSEKTGKEMIGAEVEFEEDDEI